MMQVMIQVLMHVQIMHVIIMTNDARLNARVDERYYK